MPSQSFTSHSSSSSSSSSSAASHILLKEPHGAAEVIEQSDSSVDDILPSLRTIDYEIPKSSILNSGFFEFGKPKASSTNSSPIKSSFKQETLQSPSHSLLVNNSGLKLNDDIKKSVRFKDWQSSNDQKKKTLHFRKKKDGFFHRNRTKSKKKMVPEMSHMEDSTRVPSSEYSCTPDTTDIFAQNDAPSFSEKQLKYLIPDILSSLDADDPIDEIEECEGRNTAIANKKISKKNYGSLADFLQRRDIFPESALSANSIFSHNRSDVSSETSSKPDCGSTVPPEVNMMSEEATLKRNSNHPFSSPGTETKMGQDFEYDVDETTMSLARRFNGLSLKSPEQTLKPKNFSLRLQDDQLKPSSHETPEVSYEQIDILDQNPPNLPEITVNSILDHNESKTDLTMPLFDNFELNRESISKHQLKEIIMCFSKSLDHRGISESQFDELGTSEILDLWKTLSEECLRKVESYRIQIIKNSKVLKDNEAMISNREATEYELKNQVHGLLRQVDSLQNDVLRFESKVASQSKTIQHERSLNEEHEDQLRAHNLQMSQIKYELEEKDIESQQISGLVKRYEDVLLSDEANNKASSNYDILKIILTNSTLVKENHDTQTLKFQSLNKENLEMQQNLTHLEALLKKSNHDNLDTEQRLANVKEQLERRNEQTKSSEIEIIELKRQLETANFKLMEVTQTNQELNVKLSELDKILKEQSDVVKKVQDHIDTQNEELTDLRYLRTALPLVTEERDLGTEKLKQMSVKLDEVNSELEMTKKLNTRIIQQRDEEIISLRTQNSDLIEQHSKTSIDLKETRSRLSESCSIVKVLEKKVLNLSNSLRNLQETNRSLRSDALQNGSIKTQFRRILLDLSISLVHDFQGIIDDVSLSSVKEGLQLYDLNGNELDTQKELINLNDASLFIKEAVSLVIKDYWSLSTKISNNQKSTLSASSLNALQRINDTQASKIKKLESKLQYHESVFKKIYNANELDTTSQSNDGHSDDQESVASSIATANGRKREIKRLLGKVKSFKDLEY